MKRRGGWDGCALDLFVIALVAGFVFWKWGPATGRDAVASRVRTVIRQLRERSAGGTKQLISKPPPLPAEPVSPAPAEPPAERRPDAPRADTPRVDTPPAPGEVRMTRGEYGPEWPLLVDEALLSCRDNAVYLRVDGVLYAVNGAALARRTKVSAKDFRASGLWAPDPTIAGFKKSLGPVIDKGLSLCR